MNLKNGQQAYIYQKNNRLLDAVIDAVVSASDKQPLVYPITKKGTGNLLVQGNYEGADDAQYDIKIVDSAFSDPVVSAPVFAGAGTGKIKDISAADLSAQKITVRCMSTGVNTQQAEVEILGLGYVAKPIGDEGNGISITVDISELVYEETDYSTIKELSAGATGLSGPEWDFDTKALLGDYLPSTAHRIAMGNDRLHIYRQYKEFQDGEYKYHFVPPIINKIPAGAKVYFVTEGRTITISNGVTTEEYTDIVTTADLWSAVRALPSALIEPKDSSLDLSLVPTSPAVREFSLMTDAYALASYKGDSSSVAAAVPLEDVTVTATTNTELIEATCVDNFTVGGEQWAVRGSSSGDLGVVVTNEFKDLGPIGFKIPLQANAGSGAATWSHEFDPVSRGEDTPPVLCFEMMLGINIRPQKLTFVYTAKPAACTCVKADFNEDLLGIPLSTPEELPVAMPDLKAWMSEQGVYIAENCAPEYSANVSWAVRDYFSYFMYMLSRIMNLPTPDDPESQQATDLDEIIAAYKLLVGEETVPPFLWRTRVITSNQYYSGLLANRFNFKSSQTTYQKVLEVDTSDMTISDDLVAIQALIDAYLEAYVDPIPPDVPYTEGEGNYYWKAFSSDTAYLPAWDDILYYSIKRDSNGTLINTKEFACKISSCGAFMEGDTITVQIQGKGVTASYLIGDQIFLPTIAAQPLNLAGGLDGDDTYTWDVLGDVDTFDQYLLDRNDPQPYSNSGLSFLLEDGAVKFQVGDEFQFAFEGGHFKWRVNGGTWSAAISITEAYQEIENGVEVAFQFGVEPSFIIDDQWEILCRQENKAAHLADISKFTALKATGDLDIDLGASLPIDTIVIDLHDIDGDFDLIASDNADYSDPLYNETITAEALICLLFEDANVITARYWRIGLTGEHTIGFGFFGALMQLTRTSPTAAYPDGGIAPSESYNITRQEGREPVSITQYMIKGYVVEYDRLHNANYNVLIGMINYLKLRNDEPLYFIPNIKYPGDCIRGRVDTDRVAPGVIKDHNLAPADRMYSYSIPISGAVNA